MEDMQDVGASWLRDGYERVDTLEMRDMLARGERVFLPPVTLGRVPDWVGADDRRRANDAGREVVSVEEVGEDEVQCIMVDDPDHLYLTDGLIPTHNTANIVFLKSTDDAMIETLTKMSGTTHQTYTDSKTVTRDLERVANKNEGKISYQASTKEQPVISYNDLAFIPPRNAIIFVAGGIGDKTSASVIWDRNETALPMSWRLLWSDPIKKPGTDYSLQTIPTMSSAIDFDVRANQPNFSDMILKRIEQSMYVEQAEADYKKARGYTDDDMARLDIDVMADEIMDIVRKRIAQAHARGEYVVIDGLTPSHDPAEDAKAAKKATKAASRDQALEKRMDEKRARRAQEEAARRRRVNSLGGVEDNDDVANETAKRAAKRADDARKIYAGGTLSRADLISGEGAPSHNLDEMFSDVVKADLPHIAKDSRFNVSGSKIRLSDDGTVIAFTQSASDDVKAINEAAADGNPRVPEGVDEADVPGRVWALTDEFYKYLVELDSWSDLAGGTFERDVTKAMKEG